jgi:hypothetical protein
MLYPVTAALLLVLLETRYRRVTAEELLARG